MSTKKVAGIVVAVVAALGLGEIGVAYLAGSQFQSRLKQISTESVQKNEPIELTNVHVDRGLFHSKATVDVDLVPYGIKIPIAMKTSQGFGLDGSVLRLHEELGNLDGLPIVGTILNAINDTNPMVISEAIGITGKLQKASIRISPLQTTIPVANNNVHIAWQGAKVAFTFGHFAPSGVGTITGVYDQDPFSLESPNLNAHLGKSRATFRETGKLGNLKARIHIHSGTNSINMGGKIPVNEVIQSTRMRYTFALRANDNLGDNPSGLPGPGFSMSRLHLLIRLAKPAAGNIKATGSIGYLFPKNGNLIEQLEKDQLQGVSAHLRLHVQNSILQGMLPKPALQKLVTAGYLYQEGSQYVTTFTMHGKVMKLNGKKI